MKGDFSRGHTPDRKRGQKYRRVLLQQGRVLLDSDLAASVDAQDRLLRELATDVGCRMGSPNLGYVVTAGPLFALFDTLEQVSGLPAPGEAFGAHRDHAVKLLERYPALHLDATAGAGKVSVAGRMKLEVAEHPKLRIWARIPSGVQLSVVVEGKPATVDGLDESAFRAYEVDVAALGLGTYAGIELGFESPGPLHVAWIGLVEGLQPAGTAPTFWFTAGRFYLDGLSVEHGPADGTWPETTFPKHAGFDPTEAGLGTDALLVAYLEGWERPITAVEDPGILEQALGGALDTTIRTRAMGQVKLARVTTGGLTDLVELGDAVERAFSGIDRGEGSLEVETTPSGTDPDPCAIPAAGGYSGPENRFYRFEVHAGGNLGQARIKWSKDNGATFHAVHVDDAARGLVTLLGAGAVQDGDLVELLCERDAIGDAAWGAVELTPTTASFTPPVRRAGTLYYVETTSKTSQVQLLDLATKNPASIAAVASKPGLAVRRWSGLCDTIGGKKTFDLGDGITITLDGKEFRVGDYWQYEARRNKDNANGPWQASPHGPERLFTPLALLEHDAAGLPLVLHRWYEHQYPALCELEADDVAYDGTKAETTADTVQEALDELFTRKPIVVNGCGEIIIHPESDLQAVFDSIGEGQDARVCIHPGTWDLTKTVLVANKGNIVVGGAGRATRLTSSNLARVLRFEGCTSVHVHDLSLRSSSTAIGGEGVAGALSVFDCAHVDIERVYVEAGAGNRRRISGIEVGSGSVEPPPARVRIRGCDVRVGHAQTGILVVDAESADIEDNHVECPEAQWSLDQHIADGDVAAWVGGIMMGRLALYDAQRFSSDIFLAAAVVTLPPEYLIQAGIEPDPAGRPTLAVGLDQWTTGRRVTTFTAHPDFADPAEWETLLVNNPMPGWETLDPSTPVAKRVGWVLASLRRLRRGIARAAFGAPSSVNLGGVTGPAHVAQQLRGYSSVTSGGQGIVVASRHAPAVGDAFAPYNTSWNTLYVQAPRRPSTTITGNRVIGFTQGIHVGTSYNKGTEDRRRRLRSYRVRIHGNTVHLRVPEMARERHGIFVGNAHSVLITDNLVELVYPDINRWVMREPPVPPLDGIRLWGSFGPLVQVRGNHTVGMPTGARMHALNPHIAQNTNVSWTFEKDKENNAYAGFGTASVLELG